MSFADQLRHNYNHNSDPNQRDRERISSQVSQIVWAICKSCEEVSSSSTRLSGYFEAGYDDAGRIVENPQSASFFFYHTKDERLEQLIRAKSSYLCSGAWEKDAPDLFVNEICSELKKKGFVNPIVKTMDSTRPIVVAEGFLIDHKRSIPGFVIYVEVKW